MKIRIRGNSVRLRLTKTEVEIFCETGEFSETTRFNTQIFTYKIVSREYIDCLKADFVDNTIVIFIPRQEALNWDQDERVGFKNEFMLNDGTPLNLLVEKDFVCLDKRDEDESDNYPNPLLAKK